jgi:amino acid carrier protein
MSFDQVEAAVQFLNGLFFSPTTVYILLATGIVFTFMTVFGQYRALTHGAAVVRGKYDDKDDPGAINHFQALSAALSATVGLGNIAGVAAAVALGGPGAVFWMWIIGVIGMALKMTEVTQAMLFRNTDDPDNPHGGPMFVISKGFKEIGLAKLGAAIGGLFCATLILSAITGGNMFQAWNVAAVSAQYTDIQRPVIGVVLAVIVGLVIIGGIKRIGAVAGRIVPLMCGIYVIAALAVLIANIADVPAMFWMIIEHGLGLQDKALPVNAFMGGTLAFAFSYGVQRALFSSEAGQGSSPIAHSAAKTDEPVREGIVAGLEPFIDTIVVCTMTALVLLSTGAWNREHEAPLPQGLDLENTVVTVVQGAEDDAPTTLEGVVLDQDDSGFRLMLASVDDDVVRDIPYADVNDQALNELRQEERQRLDRINATRAEDALAPIDGDLAGEHFFNRPDRWMPNRFDGIEQSQQSQDISGLWPDGHEVFVLVRGAKNENTAANSARLFGKLDVTTTDAGDRQVRVSWTPFEFPTKPELLDSPEQPQGVYSHYVGSQLTAYAFDRAFPGLNLGMYLIVAASWLFAVSTMISWSYYGEQGIVFLFGDSRAAILIYKLGYCVLVFVSTLPFIKTEAELNMWTTLGLGAMLIVNIPIMLLFATRSTSAYNEYVNRLKSGDLETGSHKPGSMHDVVTGKDVE